MTKLQTSKVIAIVLMAVLALLAVFGYDVGVIQPREDYGLARVESLAATAAVSEPQGRGVTNFDDIQVGTATFGANPIFEGATADAYETTFAITDPTADRTITIPNNSGTVALNPYGASIEFEGATANAYETTLDVVDPTADRTLTLPNETAAVMVSSLVTNGTAVTNSVTGASNGLVWEGATADAFETTVSATDPTADRSLVLPDAGGTFMLSSLATNGATITNSVTGASNGLVYEGATANDYETTLSATDPTADRTLTLPDETAALMGSSLLTNSTGITNSVTGASNGLVYEGATADTYETTLSATDPTADRAIALPDAAGTVALTSQAVDLTLTADSTGGNAGAKTEFIGLPRIKLIGGAQGTNPGSQTIALADDSPEGEFAPVDASVTEAAEAAIYRHGAGSYEAAFAAGAAVGDGFLDAALGGNASWEDMESAGLLVYSTATWAAGDLTLVLTDDGGAQTFNIPALTTVNAWTWLEVDITALAAGTGDVISDVAILMSAQGEGALGAFTMYLDIAYVWDSVDEEALGVAIQQDGVLGVINTESGASLAELTDYLVHYESGSDFIVYITDQSTADIAVLAAY